MVRRAYVSLKSFITKSKRVWMALKKPTRKEFEMVTKVSALGIVALGVLGFLISMALKAFV
jgi:protein transport protein SEC61 subunit gamma-like protein